MTAILLSGEIILVNVIVRRSSLRRGSLVSLRVIGRVHEWRTLVTTYRSYDAVCLTNCERFGDSESPLRSVRERERKGEGERIRETENGEKE